MERVEASARQPPSKIPEMVTNHCAPDSGRNGAEEVHAAGGGNYPRGQQDETTRKRQGQGVHKGGDQYAAIRVLGQPAKDAIHRCSLPPHDRRSGRGRCVPCVTTERQS